MHSQLDYRNGILVGLLTHLMCGLQSVLNAVAQLINRLRTHDHITDAVISLNWLQLLERIQHQLAVLAYNVLHGDAPLYLGPLILIDNLPSR